MEKTQKNLVTIIAMKRPMTRALCLVPVVVAMVVVGISKAHADEPHTKMTTTVFNVEGMSCGACEGAIRIAVKKLNGVEEVVASYDEGRVTVTYDASAVSTDDIKAAIKKLGYTATVLKDDEKNGGSK